MSNEESTESFWARYREAERITAALKGPPPPLADLRDAILGAMAGGFCAMLALAFAGVYGEIFEYAALGVSIISGGGFYTARAIAQKAWNKEFMRQLHYTDPNRPSV